MIGKRVIRWRSKAKIYENVYIYTLCTVAKNQVYASNFFIIGLYQKYLIIKHAMPKFKLVYTNRRPAKVLQHDKMMTFFVTIA